MNHNKPFPAPVAIENAMIKLTKNDAASRLLIFFITIIFLPLIVLYLLLEADNIWGILTSCCIVILNTSFAYWVAYNDYEIWIDTTKEKVVIKNRRTVAEFDKNIFSGFKLYHYGIFMSAIYKFYNLRLEGKRYRIRYYASKKDSIFIDLKKETRITEKN